MRRDALQVPGFETGTSGLAVVSLSGTDGTIGADLSWNADNLIAAWR